MPHNYYTERMGVLQAELDQLNRKKSVLAWLRFFVIAAAGGSWYFLISLGLWYALVPVILLLFIFTRLLFADLKNSSAIKHHQHLLTINRDELKALAHEYYQFPDGSEFRDNSHSYSNDLDIFGHASLYQYINRTRSEMGNKKLADWLLAVSSSEQILNRQVAVKELASQPVWLQTLQALGAAEKIKTETQVRLQDWFSEEDSFLNNRLWQVLRYGVPVMIIAVIVLNITGLVDAHFRNYCLLASAGLAFYINRKVALLQQQVSKMTDELNVLSASIRHIERSHFESAYLRYLQDQFGRQQNGASQQLHQLRKILDRFDLRLNFVIFIPLALLLQWDLQQAIALENWKKKNKKQVLSWFDALADFEAVSSFSTLSFNHPDWCFPRLLDTHFSMEGRNIGHPLIPANKRVSNPLTIKKSGELMLVTGSNMAGKSTYLRSIGINTILAMAGAPVCASYFCLSPVQIISSMRVADNLEESTSTFYAELKKLKTIIDSVNNREQVFVLLDEILRGTNSYDRHTGSAALIRQLIRHDAVGILATHDVELAKLKEAHPENILNYHFDVQVNKEELYFDYKLKEGICTSLNASILMKKIGIEL